jgi:protein gp37
MRDARRFGADCFGPHAARRQFGDRHWNAPRLWDAKAARDGVRRRVFCGSMCDVFELRLELEQSRPRLFRLIADTPRLDWLLLTKRPGCYERAVGLPKDWQLPPNVWLGVTAENQKWAESRIPILLTLPAAVRFVSYEPALGPVRFEQWLPGPDDDQTVPSVQWIIAGGESGPDARPDHPDWYRSVRDQCRAAGVAFFMKQMSGRRPIPADLQIQEFPLSRSV